MKTRLLPFVTLLVAANALTAAELESRQLTHYVSQDQLDSAVRTEGWTEITLDVKGGVRKGDIVRVWAGGLIDRGGGDQPGESVNGPSGLADLKLAVALRHIALLKHVEAMAEEDRILRLPNKDALVAKQELKSAQEKVASAERNVKDADSYVKLAQTTVGPAAVNKAQLALSQDVNHAFALLFKTEGESLHKAQVPGKPLEIKLIKDKERFWLGFNDEKGRYHDNHLGKGRRHELDPLWVRIEVVRVTVD